MLNVNVKPPDNAAHYKPSDNPALWRNQLGNRHRRLNGFVEVFPRDGDCEVELRPQRIRGREWQAVRKHAAGGGVHRGVGGLDCVCVPKGMDLGMVVGGNLGMARGDWGGKEIGGLWGFGTFGEFRGELPVLRRLSRS